MHEEARSRKKVIAIHLNGELQARLTKAYVDTYSRVSFEEALAAQQTVQAAVSETYKRSGYNPWFVDGPPPGGPPPPDVSGGTRPAN